MASKKSKRPVKNKQVPKLSPFKKLQAELDTMRMERNDWKSKYEMTLEGRLENMKDKIDEVDTMVDDVRGRFY